MHGVAQNYTNLVQSGVADTLVCCGCVHYYSVHCTAYVTFINDSAAAHLALQVHMPKMNVNYEDCLS